MGIEEAGVLTHYSANRCGNDYGGIDDMENFSFDELLKINCFSKDAAE